jgi:gliding motility-associated-like protein
MKQQHNTVYKQLFLLAITLMMGAWGWGQTITAGGPTTFCQGGSVVLTANPAPGGSTYQWKRDGADVGTNSSTYTATLPGTYTVVVDGTTYGGSQVINVLQPPSANFTFSPSNQCGTVPINFTNSSTGSSLSYTWDFNDPNAGSNNSSNATNPAHAFIGTPGNATQSFNVKLTASNGYCPNSSSTQSVTIKQRPGKELNGPGATSYNGVPYFTKCVNAASADLGFTNTSSTTATNTFYRIIWGDNTSDFTGASFATPVIHTYNVGTYILKFIVTGGNGCIDTTNYNVFVGSNPAVGLGNPGNTSICTTTSLTFPISNTSTNTPGTVYTVTFNDGSPSVVYTHPAPADVTHMFAITSCGTNSSTYTNSFSASIVASNPCQTSAATVVPIYVSEKPNAAFTASKDTACQNTAVTFTNTGSSGKFAPSCANGKFVWKISPATGYTVSSGTLGNDFATTDPDLWTAGTINLGITFTSIGTYTITLTTGNPNCGLDTETKTICVNAQPTANFSISSTEGCTPVNVTTTNTSTSPNCGVNRYAWTVSYSSGSGCTPNTSNYSFTGGTNASSATPQFQFVNPGTYSISLTTTSPGGCVSTALVKTVTVKAKPNVSAITATASICQGSSVSPSVTINNCYSSTAATYAWTFTGGSPTSSTSTSPGAVTYNTAGGFTLALDVTNECGTTNVTKPLTVNAAPDVTVPANKILCNGISTGALNFSSVAGGVTYSWTNTNTAIGLAASGTGNINSFNVTNSGASPITATINVTPAIGSCNGTPVSFTITVNPTPALPSVTTPVTYCQNIAATALTATPASGNTLNWYTVPINGSASATAPTPSTTTVGNTPYYVSQTNATNCEGGRAQIVVTIKQSPVIGGNSSTNPSSCATNTGSITLTGLTASTSYSVNYTKNGNPVTVTISSNGSGSLIIPSLSSGVYNNVTVTLAGCPSNTVGPFSLTDPNPPATPTAGSNGPICSGNTLTLNASSATGGVTYNWSGPNSYSSTQQNPSITNITTAGTGTYSVTATFAGCTSSSGTVAVTINPTPVTPTASSNTPICSGSNLNLSSNTTTAGTITYAWTGPNSFTDATQNPTITAATAAATGTYNVTATLGSCTSPAGTTAVTVKPTPAIGSSSSTNPTSCNTSTGTIILNGLAASTSYTVSYLKNGTPVTATINSNSSGVLTITGLASGAYTNVSVTSNGCASNIVAGPFSLSDPNPPATPTINAIAPVCSGNTLTLNASSTTSGVSYTWGGPNSFTSNAQNPSIANVTVAATGTYSVTATLAGCTSAAGTTSVTINQTPVVPTASSNSPICSGSNLTLSSNTTTAGAVTYAWTGPNSFTDAIQNPSITNATAAATGTYNVTATLGTCTSTAGTTLVTVKPTPIITIGVPNNPTACNTSTGSIVLSGLTTGSSYTIKYTKNAAVQTVNNVTASAGAVTISSLSSGTYSDIYVILNGCQSNMVGPFTLSDPNPPATPTINAIAPVCSGNTLTLNASSTTAGVSYTWSGPNSFSSALQNPAISNVTVAATGTYSVTATLAGCTSAAGTTSVTINQTPATPSVSSNSPICTGNTLNLSSSTSYTGVTYAWTGPNSFSNTNQNTSIPTATIANAGSYSLTVTSTTGNCASVAGTITVVINPTPAITTGVPNNPSACNTSTGNIVLNGLTTGSSYTIKYTKNAAVQTVNNVIASAGAVTISSLSSGTYSDIYVILNGCQSNMVGPFTLSDPNPPATPTINPIAPICSGNTLTLNANTTTAGSITYTWSGPNSFTSTTQNPSIPNATAAATGTYSVTATLNSCVSVAGTTNVTVYQTPAAPTVTSSSPVCTNNTLSLGSNTSSTGVTYAWTGPNGFTSMAKDTSITNITTAAAGVYSVVVTSTVGNCPSLAGTTTVVVNPTPAIAGNSFTNPTNCNTATGSITLTGLTASSSYTVNYTKNGTAQTALTIVANASGQVVISSLTSGTYTNISVIISNCVSNVVAGPISLTDPNPPATPIATSNGPICSGNTLTLSASSSTTGVSYAWSGPNSFTSAIAAPSITNAPALATGTYNVTATLNGCVSPAGSVAVVVNQTPASPTVNSNTPLCFGSTLNLTASTTFAGTLTYAWTGPNSFTSALQNPSIINADENASGTYTLNITATTGNCSPLPATTNVIVRPLLTQAVITGPDSVFVCGFLPPANATQNIVANLNAARPFETGKWRIIIEPVVGAGNFANSTQASTTFTYTKSGLYKLEWAITNDINCPSTKDTVVLSIADKPAINQALTPTSTSVCAGNPVTISVPAAQVVGSIRYWQFKRPYTASTWQDTAVTNPSITFNNVQDTFRVRLVVISADQVHCSGDTAFKDILINVAPPSAPGTTSGEDTVCKGSNSGIISLTGNIGSPIWQSSIDGINFNNTSITSQTYAYTNLAVTTWFRVAVSSGVCSTVFSNATKITVFPPVTIANAGLDAELCGNTSYQLNGNAPSSLETGLWTFASGSPTATIDNPTSFNSGLSNMVPNTNYQLVWTLNNGICPATQDGVLIKNFLPLTNKIDTATVTVCNSVAVTVNGETPIGGNLPYLYQWQQLVGATWQNITGATNQNYTFTATTTIKLRRLVTAVPCSNTSLEKTIYVQPPLSNNTVSGNAETCINTSPGILTGSLPLGADGNFIYQWQILVGSTWTDITNATQKDYTVPVLTVTTKFRRRVTSALCSGNQGNDSPEFQVIVRPDAKAQWVITKDTACAPFNINNSIVKPTLLPLQNSSYSWYANNILYGNSPSINPGYTLVTKGDSVTIKMVAISLYGCKNDSLERKFFTYPPVQTDFTRVDTAGCGPLAVNFTNTTPYLGFFSYFWDFGNGQTSNLIQPGTIVFASNPNFGDTTYNVVLTATSQCETVVKTKTVTVKSRPKSIFTPNKTTGCSPLTVSFTNLSKGLGVSYLWDYDDGNVQASSSAAGVTHTFNSGVQDTFKVKLIATNQCGSDTSYYNIVVSPNQVHLDFAVNGNEAQGCKQHTVHFINATSGATNFFWNFGDGNTLSTIKNIDTVTHTYLQSGTFTVTLFATNGCSDTTTTETIQVFNPPSANFSAAPITACIGDTIHFTNQSSTSTSLLWNFRDTYTSTATNPVHAYTAAGNYQVQLKAFYQYNSGLSCVDSINKLITIVSKLPGLFTVTDTVSNCVPFTATFTNQSLPSSLTTWNFGSSGTGTGNIVTHTFNQIGTYPVTMTALHPGGCTYEATKNIVVRGPAGTWQYDHGNICNSTAVRFVASVSGTDSIKFNFGDGHSVTTTSTIVYHSYEQAGAYIPTALLYSSLGNGCTVLLQGTDTIKVDFVKAGYRFAKQENCGSTNVAFTDTSRHYLNIASWQWKFGDGNTSNLQNPQHVYTATNTWTIQLITTTVSGCSDTTTANVFIKVNNKPVNSIVASLQGCVGQNVNYTAQVISADAIAFNNWSFSNGVNINGNTVNNIYTSPGTYIATLISGTMYGCNDTAVQSITVNPSPTILASIDQLVCKGQSLQLNAASAASITWGPINGTLSCTTCPNPIATPLSTTQYVATATNGFGCNVRDTVLVTVAQPIKLTVSANDTICINQSSPLAVSGATTYAWTPSATLSSNSSSNPVATPIVTTKYQVIGFDNHNCFQDTAYITVAVGQYPTIDLGADKVLATGTKLPLVSTFTNGPITNWVWSPSADLSCSNCPQPIATIKQPVCYAVTASNLYKCAARDTICIKVFCEGSQVFIPNGFTPDGDGVNDILMVRGSGIKTVKSFRIFNRWGQVVFERSNISPNDATQGWDGKIKGKAAPPEVYVYTCEVTCDNDVSYTYKGNVAILK